MRLIDINYDVSRQYNARYDQNSMVPKVWRHYQIDQLREGERWVTYRRASEPTVGERKGYSR